MNSGCAGSFFNFLIRYIPAHPVGNIFADRAGEQERFLLNDADLLTQVFARVTVQFHPVQQDLTPGVFIEPW